MSLADMPGRPWGEEDTQLINNSELTSVLRENLLQPGAGTINPEIISSLIIGGSDGGGGQTNDSMMSSVERNMPARSGGSTRDDLHCGKNNFNPSPISN